MPLPVRLSLVLLSLLAPFTPAASADTTRLGLIVPLSGDAAYWGENFQKGAALAVRDLNSQGGLLGKPIELLVEDDSCDAKRAVSAFQKLTTTAHVAALLGPVCSSPAAAVAPLANRSKRITLVCAESADIATSRYVLRLWVPNDAQGRRLASFAIRVGKKAAVLAVDNAFGEALRRAFIQEFQSQSGELTAQQTYSRDATDLRAQILKIKESRPNLVVVAGYIADGMAAVRQLREAGFSGLLFGVSTLNNADFIKPLGPLAEGMYLSDLDDSTSLQFRERWQREFGHSWPGMQSTAGMGYDGVMALAEALRVSKGDSAEALRILYREEGFNGVSGLLRFNEKGDLMREHRIYQVRGGKVMLVE